MGSGPWLFQNLWQNNKGQAILLPGVYSKYAAPACIPRNRRTRSKERQSLWSRSRWWWWAAPAAFRRTHDEPVRSCWAGLTYRKTNGQFLLHIDEPVRSCWAGLTYRKMDGQLLLHIDEPVRSCWAGLTYRKTNGQLLHIDEPVRSCWAGLTYRKTNSRVTEIEWFNKLRKGLPCCISTDTWRTRSLLLSRFNL